MSAQQQHTTWTAYLSGSTGTVAAGKVLCLNAAGTRYVVSTTANRALQTLGSVGIAITAGDDADPRVELQFCGMVPNSITGLGAGSAVAVRTSSTGTLERVASPTAADEVVGRCDEDGNCLINFATTVDALTSSPASPTNSVQYNNAGAFGGATNVHIEGGDLVVYKTGGTVATTGSIRSTTGALDVGAFELRVRDAASTRNMAVLTSYSATLSGSAKEVTTFGGYGVASSAPHYEWHYARAGFGFFLTTATPESQTNGVEFVEYAQAGPIGAWSYRRTWALQRHMNLVLMGTTSTLANPDTAIAGGEGVMGIGRAEYAPTTSPGSGFITAWVDTSDRWNYVRSNGQKVPIWDGPEKTYSTTGTSNDVSTLDSDGLPVRTLYLNGAGDQILTGFTDGREGRSMFIVVATSGGDSNTVSLTHNAGSTAANRIMCPGGVDMALENDGVIELVYSTTNSRWNVVATKKLPTGDLVGASDTQTLTNKSLTNPQMSDPYISGQIAGNPNTPSALRLLTATITFASANYTLGVLDYTAPVLLLTGTTGGARDLIAPDSAGAMFLVKNGTADTITLKKSGGAGVAITSGTKGLYVHNGTEYELFA